MRTGSFSLQVCIDGKPVREHPHKGDCFVEGVKGCEYKLRVTNNTDERVLVVLSVDGLSVMDGKPASKKDDGYVLGPNQTADIPGWRLDNSEVAKFEFSSLPAAYASQVGSGRNIGVIAAVFYRERARRTRARSMSADDMTRGPGLESFNMNDTKGLSRGVGTGFGDRAEHRVHAVNFDPDTVASGTCTIRYETREELIRRGVRMEEDRVAAADPFPADTGPGCTPPKGWRG